MSTLNTDGCESIVLRVENECDARHTSGPVKYEIVETIIIRPPGFVPPIRRFKYATISLSALHIPLKGTPAIVAVPLVFALHQTGRAEVFAIPLYTYIQGPYADHQLEVHVHHDASRKKLTQQYHVVSEYRTTKTTGPAFATAPTTSKTREWLGGVIVLRYVRWERLDDSSLDYGNVTEHDTDFLLRVLGKGDPTTPLKSDSNLNMMLHRSPEDYLMSN